MTRNRHLEKNPQEKQGEYNLPFHSFHCTHSHISNLWITAWARVCIWVIMFDINNGAVFFFSKFIFFIPFIFWPPPKHSSAVLLRFYIYLSYPTKNLFFFFSLFFCSFILFFFFFLFINNFLYLLSSLSCDSIIFLVLTSFWHYLQINIILINTNRILTIEYIFCCKY